MDHKCVRQRTVRQETAKFKSGTLPLSMYCSSPTDVPRQKIVLAQLHPFHPAQEIDNGESEDGRDDHGVQDVEEPQEVQQDEYDTDSDTESQILDRDNDDLIFIMGITTRSGRAVKVRLQP